MAAVMSHSMNKRKRDIQDVPGRAAPSLGPDSSEFTHQYINDDATDSGEQSVDFSAVLGGGVNTESHHAPHSTTAHSLRPTGPSDTMKATLAQYHTMTVPPSTEQSFLNQSTGNGGDRASLSPTEQTPISQHRPSDFGTEMKFGLKDDDKLPSIGDASPTGASGGLGSGTKPAVGTDEWHKVRRDNHKEVERRRRETINEGINELAKIVPGCEKNKGSILARAVAFITQLKENEAHNIEKWTLEKLLTEQALAELSSSCDKLKAECQRAWARSDAWKKAAQTAGLSIELDDQSQDDAD